MNMRLLLLLLFGSVVMYTSCQSTSALIDSLAARVTENTSERYSIGSNKERRCVKQLFAHLLSICVSVNYYSHPGLLGASSGFNAISLVGT